MKIIEVPAGRGVFEFARECELKNWRERQEKNDAAVAEFYRELDAVLKPQERVTVTRRWHDGNCMRMEGTVNW